MHRAEPGRLVGARQDVPLVVGLGDGEAFLASDVAAVLAHTDRVIFLEEGDVADLHADGVVVTGVDGQRRERDVHVIDWSIEAAEKGGYAHFMLKEMHEQPVAVRSAIAGRIHESPLELDDSSNGSRRPVEAVACGRLICRYRRCHRHPVLGTGRLARRSAPSRRRSTRDLVIAVTQSARRPTRSSDALRTPQGCAVVAVTNMVGSAITRECDAVLFRRLAPRSRCPRPDP
jgi:glucosamine--fructose-6-phosphate aminotransferase (isomerizing)